jgi:hypothetical protein
MFKIDGINQRQFELLTVMWEIPSLHELEEWISTLDNEDARDAETLSTLLIYEQADQILERSQDFTQANKILSKFFG